MNSPRWLGLALALALSMPTPGDAQPAKDDALPKGAVLRIGSTRLRHSAAVTALAFAPDGKTLASAGNDRQVRLWHLADGMQTLSITDEVESIDFAPDGKTFATIGRNATVRTWNAVDGRTLQEIKAPFPGAYKPAVRFQADGKNLIVASDAGGSGRISICNAELGIQRSAFNMPLASFFKIALSPNGKRAVAGGGRDKSFGVWDVESGKQLFKLPGPDKDLTNAGSAFSADGRYVAAGGVFNEVTIWELATAQPIYTLPTRDPTFAFSPDGRTLASCGQSADVRIWDLATGEERRKLPHAQAQALAFSPDGRRLATGSRDGTIRLWDADGQPSLTETAAIGGKPIAFVDNGKRLALETPGGVVYYALTVDAKDKWSAKTQNRLPGFRGQMSPDGATFVGFDASRNIVLWDVQRNTERRHLGRGDDVVGPAFAFTSDGRTLALTTNRGIALIEAESGKKLKDLDKSWFRVALAFTPDGKTLIAADNKTLRFWDMNLAKVIRQVDIPRDPRRERDFELDLHRGAPTMQISSTGNVLALGGTPLPVQLWDVGKGAPLGAPKDCGPFTFSPDGRWLATAQNTTVRLWELATGIVFAERKGHDGAVTSLLFSPDGQTLASGGADHTTLLWDVRPQRLFAQEPPGKWDDAQRTRAWDALTALDSAAAYVAMARLALDSAGTAAFLDNRLTPVAAPPAKQIDQWIADLGSKNFETRDRAATQLQKLGILAQPAMQIALKANIDLEQKRRLETLLAQIGNDEIALSAGDQLRVFRAIHLLETLRSPEARRTLERLAAGTPQASQTAHAQRALQRLKMAER